MTIREKIMLDLSSIDNSSSLYQIFKFVHLIKKNLRTESGNSKDVLSFAGSLSDEDAMQIQRDISEEFSNIEGNREFQTPNH